MIKGNVAACPVCNCISKRRLLELLNIINATVPECNPLPSSIVTATPKRIVTVSIPIGIIADGNDIYVDSNMPPVGVVSKYDQDGNLITTFSFLKGGHVFLKQGITISM